MVELLSPAGDMECLISAVQNGADAVYFGGELFNARANTKNFNKEEMAKAIEYAKLRGVKTHLTVNILIKNNEFEEAMELVNFAYKEGIDAVIVQDLGLAKRIIKSFPGLEVHSSTQMTIYNLDGVQEVQDLGFTRCVLARELSIDEIKHICKNTNIDIEVFIHGALCICYSGQCLMSSMIGGRSGNRGKCAGTCRLPYTLLKDGKPQEKGYLLSSKDVCTLDILPELINAGVKSFKIEGRMKSKEYVGIVTSIYRKYIDLAENNKEYIVDEKDREILMQIFNRGGFSTGYLKGKLGKDMMFFNKPNHIGLELGEVLNYNPNKGYVKLKLKRDLNLGDSIQIREASCKVSELMVENQNIKYARIGQIVTIGRLKGKINKNDIAYKTVDIALNQELNQKIKKENIKREINAKIVLKQNEVPILELEDIASGIIAKTIGDTQIQKAQNVGITNERIKEQLLKTGNTIFNIKDINICASDSINIPISSLNNLRRNALEKLEKELITKIKRQDININLKEQVHIEKNNNTPKVYLNLNNFRLDVDYSKLEGIEGIYIPFKFFLNKELKENIDKIIERINTYVLLPNITKYNYEKLLNNYLESISEKTKGIVISNLSQLNIIKNLKIEVPIIANYTLNIENDYSVKELANLGITKYTVPAEVERSTIQNLSRKIRKEGIVYGRTLLMTTEYCTIGTFKNCPGICEDGKFVLKDRMNFEFPIYTDRINCNNLIYNAKTTSISYKDLNLDSIRIDILNEDLKEIQNIIDVHKTGDRLEGQDYTNGNLNREV